MLVDVLRDLLEEVISNIFECLYVCADSSHGGIYLTQRLEHKVLPLVLQHSHDLSTVSVVLPLLFLLHYLQLLELFVGFLQFFELREHLLQLLLPYRHTSSSYSINLKFKFISD